MSEPSAERIKLLSLVDIFEPLSEEEIERLDGLLPDRHLENGEIFYRPEDPSERLFILQKGKVRIFRTTPDGREFTLAVVESGTVFGEMALTAKQLEGAYAEAMEPSQVSTMARETLEHLVLEKPEVGLQIMRVLRRLMCNCSDEKVGQVAQRPPEPLVEALSTGVGCDLGR